MQDMVGLFAKGGVNKDTVNQDGENALHRAIAKGIVTPVESLINLGVDINHKNNAGQTPLAYANAIYADSEIIDLLVAHGATE